MLNKFWPANQEALLAIQNNQSDQHIAQAVTKATYYHNTTQTIMSFHILHTRRYNPDLTIPTKSHNIQKGYQTNEHNPGKPKSKTHSKTHLNTAE